MAGSNVSCSVCAVTLTRQGLDKNCACSEGHYDNSEVDCVECVAPCGNCSSETICTSCITTNGREPAPTCDCSSGFYEDTGNNCI